MSKITVVIQAYIYFVLFVDVGLFNQENLVDEAIEGEVFKQDFRGENETDDLAFQLQDLQFQISKEFDQVFSTESDIGNNVSYTSVKDSDTPTKLERSKRSSKRLAWRRKKIKKEFKKYEKCKDKNEKLSKKFYSGFVKAQIAMDGQSLKLSCLFCIRPDQSVKYHNIKWRRRVLSSAKEKPIKIDHEHFVLLPDKTLQINHITREDGGIYYCYQGKGHAATYMVDVLRGERYDTVFNPPDRGKRPAGPKDLEQYNIKIISNWSPWSKCNRCNKRGQHRRIGFCSVKKLDQDKPIKPEHIHWFDQFKDGLPCRSSLLPLSVKGLKEIKYRKSEILMGYCFKPCPTLPPIKTYTDAKGKVLEVVKIHKGFVSMREEVPKLPKMVKRKMIYEKRGRRIKLDCPHGRKGDIAVRWQNGSQTLNALTVRRESRGRIVIDPLNNLRIRRLKMYDTAAYSCWIDGEHIATIKIRVIARMKRSYKDYILLAGFIAVFLILFCVGCAVCRAQRKRSYR